MMREIERRLMRWARWQTKQAARGEGYCSTSSIQGVDVMHHVPIDFKVEQMSMWIDELGKWYPHLSETLQMHYLNSGLMPEKAARLGCAYGTFKMHLDQAKYWLAGRLFAENKR